MTAVLENNTAKRFVDGFRTVLNSKTVALTVPLLWNLRPEQNVIVDKYC